MGQPGLARTLARMSKHTSPAIPDWSDVPEDDEAEPRDAVADNPVIVLGED